MPTNIREIYQGKEQLLDFLLSKQEPPMVFCENILSDLSLYEKAADALGWDYPFHSTAQIARTYKQFH